VRHLAPQRSVDGFGVGTVCCVGSGDTVYHQGLPVESAHLMRLAALNPPDGLLPACTRRNQTSQLRLVDLIMLHAIVAQGVLQNQHQTVFLNRG
jgi:hypothetical protein